MCILGQGIVPIFGVKSDSVMLPDYSTPDKVIIGNDQNNAQMSPWSKESFHVKHGFKQAFYFAATIHPRSPPLRDKS